MNTTRFMLVVLAALSFAARGEVDHIEITPRKASIKVGDQQRFTIDNFDVNGDEVATTPNWSTTGGEIDADGEYTATEGGSFEVTASVEGSAVADTAHVDVGDPGALARIEITPQNVNIRVGGQQRFTVTGFDAADTPVVWSNWYWSSTSGKVSVTPDPSDASECTVTGLTAGVDTIVCRSDTNEHALAGRTRVTVESAVFPLFWIDVYPQFATIPAGRSLALLATGYDMFNNPVEFVPQWSSDGGRIENGVFTATTTGTFNVWCGLNGSSVTGTAAITVSSPVIESVDASAADVTMRCLSGSAGAYTLQYRNTLTGGAWSNVAGQTDVGGTGGMLPLMDSSVADTSRFYRIVVETENE